MKYSYYLAIVTASVSLGFGMLVSQENASAFTTYHSIPRALRGYYISRPANDSLKITQHQIVEGSPLADSYSYRVTKVNYSKHHYHVHSYIDLGGRSYFTLKLNHYAKNKIQSGHAKFNKVKKTTYSYFLNHWNSEYDYGD